MLPKEIKPVWGCLLCKRNKPHQHELSLEPIRKPLPFSKARTATLMNDIHKIFFTDYRGRWYTIRPIDETNNSHPL